MAEETGYRSRYMPIHHSQKLTPQSPHLSTAEPSATMHIYMDVTIHKSSQFRLANTCKPRENKIHNSEQEIKLESERGRHEVHQDINLVADGLSLPYIASNLAQSLLPAEEQIRNNVKNKRTPHDGCSCSFSIH